jgi:hypothetical protein
MNKTTAPAALEACIRECTACHDLCVETAQWCLEQGGPHAAPDHVRFLLDCAEICQTSANFMLRKSELHALVCDACAEICTRCAEDCERFSGDSRMEQCAAVCRSCAESCRNLAGMHD